MKKKAGILIGILIAVAVIIFCIWYFVLRDGAGASDASNTAYVTPVANLSSGNAGTQNRYNGTVEAQAEVKVEKDSGKVIKEIYVKVGDTVKKNQKLFSYDVDEIKLSQSQCELDIQMKEQSITAMKAQLEQLNKEKNRAASTEQLEYTVRIQTVENEIRRAEYELSSKKLELDRIKEGLKNTVVKSPAEGIIKSIKESNNGGDYGYGDYGDGGQDSAFITIMNLGAYRVKGTINEQNVYTIYEGLPMIIHSRVDDRTWKGYVSEIGQEPENNNNGGGYYYEGPSMGETSSKYPFYIELEEATDLMLGQHVYMEADFGQEDIKEGIWLYAGYIVFEEAQQAETGAETGTPAAYVWARGENGKLEKRTVTLGEYDMNLDEYQIVEGLAAEDAIAWPQESLKAGMQCVESATPVIPEDPGMSESGEFNEGEFNENGEELEYGSEQGIYTEDDLEDPEKNEGEDGIDGEDGETPGPGEGDMVVPDGQVDVPEDDGEGAPKGEQPEQSNVPAGYRMSVLEGKA
ncbi:MAG: hypothetical protein IJL97_05465 [Lachnospiraceae bacterium]|nr:hypothetical protein [Lachnospiraceae bacterium]